MFSDNQKISPRQLRALLIMDWLGKMALVLPGLFRGFSAETVFVGVLAGLAFSAVFLRFTMSVIGRLEMDYVSSVKNKLGNAAHALLYVVYGIFYLYHTALLLYLCGRIAGTYLLPETSVPVLILLPAVVGSYLAWGGMEVRARVNELLAFLIWGVFLILLLLTVPEIKAARIWRGEGIGWPVLLPVCYFTMACFGEIGALPLAFPSMLSIQKEDEDSPSLRKAGTGGGGALLRRAASGALVMSGGLLLLTFLEGFGMFGQEGMNRLEWPVITLMSSAKLPGFFLQRWDVLLTGLLLAAMFLSSGSGMYYLAFLGRRSGMQPKAARMGALVLPALLAVSICELDSRVLLEWYSRVSFFICVPGMGLLMTAWYFAEGWRRKPEGGVKE